MIQNHSYKGFTFRQVVEYRRDGVLQAGSQVISRDFGSDILAGSNNKDWELKIAKDQDAGSAYTRRKVDSITPFSCNGSGTRLEPSSPSFYGNLHLLPSTLSVVDQTASVTSDQSGYRDRAVKSVKNKLNDKAGRMQLLVPIAEVRDMHRTYQSMANLTISFLNSVVTSKKRFLRNPRQAVSNFTRWISDAWLTYSFGVSPTMGDFEQLCESITKRLDSKKHIREVGGCSLTRFTSGKQQFYVVGDFPAGANYCNRVDVNWTVVYKMLYLFTAGRVVDFSSSTGMSSMNTQFQTNIQEVIPAAYELFPFSWLLDYFTSAGDVINDVFESPYGTTLYNYETRVSEWSIIGSSSPIYGSKFDGSVSATSQLAGSGKDIRRIKLANLPHQSLRIKTFDEISAHADKKLKNLFAIAAPSAVKGWADRRPRRYY